MGDRYLRQLLVVPSDDYAGSHRKTSLFLPSKTVGESATLADIYHKAGGAFNFLPAAI